MNVMLDVVGLDIRYGSSQVLFGLKFHKMRIVRVPDWNGSCILQYVDK